MTVHVPISPRTIQFWEFLECGTELPWPWCTHWAALAITPQRIACWNKQCWELGDAFVGLDWLGELLRCLSCRPADLGIRQEVAERLAMLNPSLSNDELVPGNELLRWMFDHFETWVETDGPSMVTRTCQVAAEQLTDAAILYEGPFRQKMREWLQWKANEGQNAAVTLTAFDWAWVSAS
jgi:hypothetical protein